ncbi:hypothetical protein BSK66_07920 [Paenibacillus odorifer]|uniref:GIY-YIG domain-containing protein n=1 Tax=Paenibacillus odorifer TaxID=189426 RepID=A0A1R0X311_9BACL|nr:MULTISPECIES: GIY-YIG nuclease family protein [Paenibacillus]ETT64930.1 hypothetical protein C171_07937 [Paenibacillus sp. FSL H8-237]OMD27486.1 hypothetical protein BJP51_25150 [Paenibacillus odorifer]OME61048.1 hypothetical protein BSK66_07920 [Paenibacillus odorifer]
MAVAITMPTDTLTIPIADVGSVLEALRFRPGGVYVFYDGLGECLYVGQSKTLPDRLRKHLTSSPFAHEIASVTLYFVSDPYEREIYETYAITTFNGKYNRAKKFEQRTANPLVSEEIDEAYFEIDELMREKNDLDAAIKDIDERHIRRPPRRKINRRGYLTRRYLEYLAEMSERTEEEKAEMWREQCERKRMVRRVVEIDSEFREIKDKITRLLRKLAV